MNTLRSTFAYIALRSSSPSNLGKWSLLLNPRLTRSFEVDVSITHKVCNACNMHRLFAFFALLPICMSVHADSQNYFIVPEAYNVDNDQSSPYIYTTGSMAVFVWSTDYDSVELYLYHDEQNWSYLQSTRIPLAFESDTNYSDSG
jgi:hypothetical protein